MSEPTEDELQFIVRDMVDRMTSTVEIMQLDYEDKYGNLSIYPALVHSALVEMTGVNVYYSGIKEDCVDEWLNESLVAILASYEAFKAYAGTIDPPKPVLRLVE